MALRITDTFKLRSGHLMPVLGFGVYRAQKADIKAALEAGYRHLDSAQLYGNEQECGEVVRESSLDRKDIFMTTKILRPHATKEKTIEAIDQSLKKIGLGYVDLMLVHSPMSGAEGRKLLWQALEEVYERGDIKSIGVSNYSVKHLEEMKQYAKVLPAVNQVIDTLWILFYFYFFYFILFIYFFYFIFFFWFLIFWTFQ